MLLRTARLRLEPVCERDVDLLLTLLHEPVIRRYLCDDAPVGRDWAHAQVLASMQRFAAGSVGLFLSRPQDEPASVAGFTGLIPVFDPPVLELVYALAPAFMGRGLATEMAAAVLDLLFGEHGFLVARASTDEPNVASIRVVERLGMTLAGRTPGPLWPQVHFELRRERWLSRKR